MDVEQTLRILLEQQQQMGAHQERLAEDHRRLEGYLERIAQSQLQLLEMQSRQDGRMDQLEAALGHLSVALGKVAEEHRSLVQEVAANQQRTELRFQELAGRVQEVADAQRHTDENLNALIKVVDDLIRRDGKRG